MVVKNVQVNVRMTADEIVAIDKLIATGDFDSRTEFIRYCVRKVLVVYSGQRIGLDPMPETKIESGRT